MYSNVESVEILLVEVYKKSSWLLSQVMQDKASTSLQTPNIVNTLSNEKANITVILTSSSKIYMLFRTGFTSEAVPTSKLFIKEEIKGRTFHRVKYLDPP